MNLRHSILLAVWLTLCSAAGSTPYAASAQVPAAHANVSMDQAVKMAEQRFHARVIKAQTQRDGGRTVYILRLLNDSSGKVWTVHMDAANGAII
jgi:uncharacterized membrane protein YkoI